MQKVNLPLLAALTPPEHIIRIVDVAFAPDDMNEEVDLVGIREHVTFALKSMSPEKLQGGLNGSTPLFMHRAPSSEGFSRFTDRYRFSAL